MNDFCARFRLRMPRCRFHNRHSPRCDELGGAVFERGLLRVHTVDFAGIADAYVVAGLPEFAGTIPCFAFDSLGREFSLDSTRVERDDPGILMFEPGTAETLGRPRYEAIVPHPRFRSRVSLALHNDRDERVRVVVQFADDPDEFRRHWA